MFKIKSGLMDLWTEKTALQSYDQWFAAIKPKLIQHFGLVEVDFFIYDKGGFMTLKGHKSTSKRKGDLPYNVKSFTHASFLSNVHERGYRYADDFVLFRNWKMEPLGLLILKTNDRWRSFATSPYLQELEKVVSHLIQTIKKMVYLVKEEKSFRQLFGVTELFNSTMDSNVILDGIVAAVSESFPSFQIELLLSQDQIEMKHKYRLFDYMNESPSAMRAYVSGEMSREEIPELSLMIINAPLKGRQGIYGVLQIKASLDFIFSPIQNNFIRMVANTAGSALENASLYDQSHRLIEDLQLVNETSRKLNSNMEFGEMIAYLKKQLIKAFQPSEIAFVFKDDKGKFDISQSSTDLFRTVAGKDYVTFALNHLQSGKEALFDANFSHSVEGSICYQSFIAIPIKTQENLTGFVVLMHLNQCFFSFDSFKLMQSLIGHSSLALANSLLRDQLQELVDKDHLTKLYTRSYLDNIIEKSIDEDEAGVFVLIDVDDFKNVNDIYGHATGDDVLKQIASTIISEVSGKGFAGRWGGEEIAIFLPFIKFEEGLVFTERLLKRIPEVTEPSVTVSIGMQNWISKRQTTYTELFNHTDRALYEAKNNGKNQLVYNDSTSCSFS